MKKTILTLLTFLVFSIMSNNVVLAANPGVIGKLVLNPQLTKSGQPATLSFTIENNTDDDYAPLLTGAYPANDLWYFVSPLGDINTTVLQGHLPISGSQVAPRHSATTFAIGNIFIPRAGYFNINFYGWAFQNLRTRETIFISGSTTASVIKDLYAEIYPFSYPRSTIRLGQNMGVSVRVHNIGTTVWKKDGANPFRCRPHLYDATGKLLVWDLTVNGWALPKDVVPGEYVDISLSFQTTKTGRYILGIDMVQENVKWFGDEVKVTFEVIP